MSSATVDIIIVSCILILFSYESIYELGNIMKFRIVEKHDGTDYYYIVEQYNWGRWKRCSDSMFRFQFPSCKEAEIALDNWHMKMTVNNIIMEKTL